jgi:hypothetical protein
MKGRACRDGWSTTPARSVPSPENPLRLLEVTPAANTDPNAFRLITISLWSLRYWCVVVPFSNLDGSFRDAFVRVAVLCVGAEVVSITSAAGRAGLDVRMWLGWVASDQADPLRAAASILSPTSMSMFFQYSNARSSTSFDTPLRRCPTTFETSRSRAASSITWRTNVFA